MHFADLPPAASFCVSLDDNFSDSRDFLILAEFFKVLRQGQRLPAGLPQESSYAGRQPDRLRSIKYEDDRIEDNRIEQHRHASSCILNGEKFHVSHLASRLPLVLTSSVKEKLLLAGQWSSTRP